MSAPQVSSGDERRILDHAIELRAAIRSELLRPFYSRMEPYYRSLGREDLYTLHTRGKEIPLSDDEQALVIELIRQMDGLGKPVEWPQSVKDRAADGTVEWWSKPRD